MGSETIHRIMKVGLCVALIAGIILAYAQLPALEKKAEAFTKWVTSHPYWGPFVIGAIYMVAEVLFVPRVLLTVGTGFALKMAYGTTSKSLLIGVPVVVLAAFVASVVSFLMGRYIFKTSAKNLAAKYPLIGAIDKAMESDGFFLMTLLHFCPLVPFSILNFVIGITSMSLLDFCLSIIGIIPGTIVYILMGTSIQDVRDIVSAKKSSKNSQINLAFVITGSLIGLIGIAYTSYVTKKYFDEIVKKAEEEKRFAEFDNDQQDVP